VQEDDGIDRIRKLLSEKPRPIGWAERRQRIDEIGAIWPPASDVKLTPVFAAGVEAEWSLTPGADPSCVLLYFHGGGYCSGSLNSHRRLVTEAGRAAAVRTLAAAYRLAPEHPFPAALEDATRAWQFLRAQGIAAKRIAIGGDSAGGGLAVALIVALRDAGEDMPACAWLISPWSDLTLSGASLKIKDAVDPLIHKPYLQELAEAYLTNADPRDPRASPLYADLSGLPPVLIQVGTAEALLSDATRFAEALGLADVPVSLEIWPHMIHASPMWNAQLEEGRQALTNAGAFIRGHLSV